MLDYLRAQLDLVRLDVHQRDLRGRELAALARLGQVTLGPGGTREGRLAMLAAEGTAARSRLAALADERKAALTRSRAELAEAPRWMAPVILVRGVSARVVLRRRRAAVERQLHELHLTAGRLAMATTVGGGAAREVQTIRAELAAGATERARQRAALAARPLPAWVERARAEGKGLGEAVWSQLRSHLTPKAPALAGMAVGWWITRTYTDSHARSILRSVGIGHGGTHLVSASTLKAMQFGLPLLAAGLCAYLGGRIAAAMRPARASH